MGDPTGFTKVRRAKIPKRPVDERVHDYRYVYKPLPIVNLRAQASRCTVRKPARKLQAAITDLLDTMSLAELGGDDVPVALAVK